MHTHTHTHKDAAHMGFRSPLQKAVAEPRGMCHLWRVPPTPVNVNFDGVLDILIHETVNALHVLTACVEKCVELNEHIDKRLQERLDEKVNCS